MSEAEMNSFSEVLISLHRLASSEGQIGDSLQRVAQLAKATVPNVTAVGLTLKDGDSGTTVAFAGDAAPELDQAQYDDNTGPCLDAFREDVTIHLPRIVVVESRWPTFVMRASEMGIHSSLSIPLRVDSRPVGALNLYAAPEDAFDANHLSTTALFAEQASLAATNAQIYWQVRELADHLRTAVESRDVIGQAKGILMREHRESAEDAFERIREASSQRNVKVIDLAEEIILAGELPDPPAVSEPI
jgi:GAF domain-containing protein